MHHHAVAGPVWIYPSSNRCFPYPGLLNPELAEVLHVAKSFKDIECIIVGSSKPYVSHYLFASWP